MRVPAFAGEQVIADRRAMDALRSLSARLRSTGYRNVVASDGSTVDRFASEMALGYPVPLDGVDDVDIAALVSTGAADLDEGRVVPRFELFAFGEALVLIPRDGRYGSDRVYFGRDSLWLAEFSSRFAQSRGALADLGTGAGTIPALLAPSFDVVVATDILPRTAACAAITFALNPRADGAPAAHSCVADVAMGLAPGTFALVTGNPPWVPTLDPFVHGPSRVYAEGGTTGFELPRRFMVEGAMLLAPDGVMVIAALDITWDTGERPLRSLARGLGLLGFDVHIEPTGIDDAWSGTELDVSTTFSAIRSAQHVALVVHRPRRGSRLSPPDMVRRSGVQRPPVTTPRRRQSPRART